MPSLPQGEVRQSTIKTIKSIYFEVGVASEHHVTQEKLRTKIRGRVHIFETSRNAAEKYCDTKYCFYTQKYTLPQINQA